jgi:hypothetical protein
VVTSRSSLTPRTLSVATGRQEIQVLEKIKGSQAPALVAPISIVAGQLQDESDLSATENAGERDKAALKTVYADNPLILSSR